MTNGVLQKVEQINDTTYTFWFKPERPIEYTAGQFVEIYIPHNADNRGTHRWFTLSSSPSENLIAVTTRKATNQSSFKKLLFGLSLGDSVQISQAMGDFVLPMQKSIPIIFLVRGIGVTPLRSMVKYLQDTGEKREISVIYSTKDKSDLMFTDLVGDINAYEAALNTEAQEPTQKAIHLLKKAPTARLYISGPEQFVEIAYKQLIDEGIKNSSLVTDYFHGYEA